MFEKLILALLPALVWASLAFGQTYPDYETTTVNDYADLLSAAQEETLRERLTTLKQETGVEMTVLTLVRQAEYAPGVSMETFATNLFDHWGIGDASRNDGVLVLVLLEDRAMRIELGQAFGHDWDDVAQHVIGTQFLPFFKIESYGTGIVTGSSAVIDQIVEPYLAGADAPDLDTSSDRMFWVVAAMGLSLILVTGRGGISDILARVRPCPGCGQRGMRARRTIVTAATKTASGQGRRTIRCPNCGHEDESFYIISRISTGSGSGGFGGGSSGGGGASGRW